VSKSGKNKKNKFYLFTLCIYGENKVVFSLTCFVRKTPILIFHNSRAATLLY